MAKKTTQKKAAKTASKKTVKKATIGKAPRKSANEAAKKPAKKTAGESAKRAAPRKPGPQTRQTPAATVQQTSILARVDVGFGNNLYVRGEGAELNWDQGILMENVSPYEWAFKTTQAKSGMVFKFLINDEVWAEGENLTVSAGGTSISSPVFHW